MSLPMLDNESPDFHPWDSYSNFLDQAINHLDGTVIEWPPGSWNNYFSLPDDMSMEKLSVENEKGSINELFDLTSPLTAKSSEVASHSPAAVERPNEVKKPRTKRRGRPKLDSDTESIKERRKLQVRLAQQAYRQRKEGNAVLLQKENEDLKYRLANVQIYFDKLLAIAMTSNLHLQQLPIVHELTKEVDKCRLPQVLAEENHAPKNEPEVQSSLTPPTTDQEPIPDYIAFGETALYSSYNSPQPQDSSRDVLGILQSTPQILTEPSFSPFDQLASVPLPFAVRLRVEALKRGYQLITDPKTSFVALRRVFAHHIFSDNRDGIMRRIYLHLYQSIKFIGQMDATGARQLTIPVDSFKPELLLNTLPQTSTQNSTDLMVHYSISGGNPINEKAHTDPDEGYIYPEDVARHLLQRGLDITTGSNFVSISRGQVIRTSQTPTLFEEIAGDRELNVSVRKLLHELLNRVTCLDLGPGFRLSEIDEALRLTIIDAV